MIPIDDIFFFNTVDKSPDVFEFDSNVFNVLTPSTTKELEISDLTLNASASTTISQCFKGHMDSVVKQDFEQFQTSLTSSGTALYDYIFTITIENENKEFDRTFADLVGFFASSNWQIIYKSQGQWFICYAELQLSDSQVTNNVIQTYVFEASDAKELIYTINNFVVE